MTTTWRDAASWPREDCAACGGEHATVAAARACAAHTAAPVAGACPHCGGARDEHAPFLRDTRNPVGCPAWRLFPRTHRCAEPATCRAGCDRGRWLTIDDPGDRPARLHEGRCARCNGSGFEPSAERIPA